MARYIFSMVWEVRKRFLVARALTLRATETVHWGARISTCTGAMMVDTIRFATVGSSGSTGEVAGGPIMVWSGSRARSSCSL